MLSASFEKAYLIFFDLNDKLKFVPIDYNPKTNTFNPTKDKYKVVVWILMSCLTIGVTVYLSGRLLIHAFVPEKSLDPVLLLFYGLAWIFFIVSCVLNMTWLLMPEEGPSLFSRAIKAEQSFRREIRILIKRNPRRPAVDIVGWAFCLFPIISPFLAFAAAFFAVFVKWGQFNHAASEITPDWVSSSILFRTTGFCLVYIFSLFTLFHVNIFCLTGIHHLRAIKFELGYLLHVLPEYFEALKKMKQNEEAEKVKKFIVRWFHAIRFLNGYMNHYSRFVIPTFFMGSFSIGVVFNYATIALHSELPVYIYAAFPFGSILLVILEMGFFPQAAKMNTMSHDIVNKWTTTGDKYIVKACKAFQPLQMRVGPFFYFNQDTTFEFFDILINYTIDLLLSIDA